MNTEITIIKRIRFELQWSQSRLAQELGMHRAHLSRVERGLYPLTPEPAQKLNRIVEQNQGVLNASAS